MNNTNGLLIEGFVKKVYKREAAKYELAVHMANELNLKGKERKYFIEHRKKTTW